MRSRGKSINLFLMDGSPAGRIKCTLANWTGIAYKIPRTELEKCKGRDDLAQSGVYFLFGSSEETGKDLVYVGQAGTRKNGEGILYRLQEHKRNSDKDYWTEAVVFTTANNSFGQTEISWLENQFCLLAKAAKRYLVKNSNNPSSGNITEEKESELEEFVDYAKIVMGTLGHKVFESLTQEMVKTLALDDTTSIYNKEDMLFYCKRRNLEARGRPTPDGFVVLAGSRINKEVADYLPNGYKLLRDKYSDSINSEYVLEEDVLLNSPSAASSFVIGKNTNGLTEWKTTEGKTLKEIEASQSEDI